MKDIISRYFGRNDIILLTLVVLALTGYFVGKVYYFDRDGVDVVITVGDEEYGSYPISVDRVISIEIDGEIANTVVIEDRSVYMKEATCPDKYCVKQGKVKLQNSSIVCLPHKVVVSVTGNTGVIDSISK